MFCPKCKTEYREGFATCVDCQVDLLERLPEEPRAEPNILAGFTVFESLDQFAAGQLCAFLEAHGVPAHMHGPSVVNPYDIGGSAGIVQVLVPEELVALARDLQASVQLEEERME